MNVPAPSIDSHPRTARISATAAAAGGTPLAILSVMLWENHFGTALDSMRACAVGSVGAGLFTYAWHVVTTLVSRRLNV